MKTKLNIALCAILTTLIAAPVAQAGLMPSGRQAINTEPVLGPKKASKAINTEPVLAPKKARQSSPKAGLKGWTPEPTKRPKSFPGEPWKVK
jgi:hypothetical protein